MVGDILLQSDGIGGIISILIFLALFILPFAGFYKMLKKAGLPGWGVIPLINLYFIVKMAERPVWWLILLLIPLVNLFAFILLHIDIAKKFGAGIGFGLGMTFFSFIFYPLLGFGDYQYRGGGGGRGGRGGRGAPQ